MPKPTKFPGTVTALVGRVGGKDMEIDDVTVALVPCAYTRAFEKNTITSDPLNIDEYMVSWLYDYDREIDHGVVRLDIIGRHLI